MDLGTVALLLTGAAVVLLLWLVLYRYRPRVADRSRSAARRDAGRRDAGRRDAPDSPRAYAGRTGAPGRDGRGAARYDSETEAVDPFIGVGPDSSDCTAARDADAGPAPHRDAPSHHSPSHSHHDSSATTSPDSGGSSGSATAD